MTKNCSDEKTATALILIRFVESARHFLPISQSTAKAVYPKAVHHPKATNLCASFHGAFIWRTPMSRSETARAAAASRKPAEEGTLAPA